MKYFFLILILTFFISGCLHPYANAHQDDLKRMQNAIDKNDINICQSFADNLLKERKGFFSYEDSFLLKNKCYYEIAKKTKNSTLCFNLYYYDRKLGKVSYSDINTANLPNDNFRLYIESCIQDATPRVSPIYENQVNETG